MEILKLLSTSEIAAQIVSFLILLTLLRIFAWEKILGVLDKRKEKIALEFKHIEETKAQVEKVKSDYLSRLKGIEEEASLKLQVATQEAKLILEEARKNGYIQAQKIIDNAKASIKFELAKAKDELKNEIVDLTLKATENIIKEKFTDTGDRKLVEEFLQEIEKLE